MSDATYEKLFDEIEHFIAESHALLEQGAIMEMAGLDSQVKVLCDQVLALSQDDRVRHAKRLQKLLGDLTVLGNSMVAHRDAMAEEIRNLADHQKANVAYRVVEIGDKPKKDE